MTRRANGEASIVTLKDGSWRAAFRFDREDGTTGRKYLRATTQTDARRKLREAQRQVSQGVVADGTMTVAKWLEHWLSTMVDGRVGSDNTRKNYEQIVRVHLVPALGKVKLDKLSPEQVDRFLKAKADEGLGRSHVGRMRTLLGDALTHAERRGLVARNAAALSVMPKTEAPTERQSLTPTEARGLLAAAGGERLEALVVVGGSVGLRPGELTGLLWSDIDLEATPPALTVSGSLKRRPKTTGKGYELERGAVKRSKDGRRTVALPPRAVAALKAHGARQARERLLAGELWHDQGLVFASEVGTPVVPSALRRVFARIAKAAGLTGAFPYLLRHTTVSLLLDDGASIEEVADLLGDDPRTLYRYYRHKVRAVADVGLRMERVLGEP
jgi:integrase